MASVKPYGNGQWRSQISVTRNGQTLRDSNTFESKREAVRWGAQRDAELIRELEARGAGNFGLDKTLADAFRRYGEEVSPQKRGERWELVRLAAFSRMLPVNLALSKITEAHIATFRDDRLKKVSSGSVLREFKLLSNVFEVARRDWKWLTVNPVKDIRRPKSPKHRDRLITSSEIRKMCHQLGYKANKSPENISQAVAVCFLIALRTGMRSGEITNLTWDRVYSKHLHLDKTKTDNPRDVPLSRRSTQLINLLRGRDATLVAGVSDSSRDTLFRNARKKAKLEGFTFHDARHNAATRIGKQVGRPDRLTVFEFAKMFGWADLKFAMVYVNPSAADVASRL